MQASGEDRYGPAVDIMRWVPHELIIERQHDALDHVHGVEGLENFLGTIVDLTVADEDSETARREVIAVIYRKIVDRAGNPDAPVPCSIRSIAERLLQECRECQRTSLEASSAAPRSDTRTPVPSVASRPQSEL